MSFLGKEGGKRCPPKWVYSRGLTPVWVCFQRVYIHMWVFLEGLHRYEPLEMGSCELLEASGLNSHIIGVFESCYNTIIGLIFIVFGMCHNGWVAETPAHTSG